MLKHFPTKILGCEICGMKGMVKPTKNLHRIMLRKLSFQIYTSDNEMPEWICGQCEQSLIGRYNIKLQKESKEQNSSHAITPPKKLEILQLNENCKTLRLNEIKTEEPINERRTMAKQIPETITYEISDVVIKEEPDFTDYSISDYQQSQPEAEKVQPLQDIKSELEEESMNDDDESSCYEDEEDDDEDADEDDEEEDADNDADKEADVNMKTDPTSNTTVQKMRRKGNSSAKLNYKNTYAKVDDSYFICKLCTKSQKFTYSRTVTKHIKYLHFGFRYICTDCGFKTKNRKDLEQHYKSIHNIIAPAKLPTTSKLNPSKYEKITKPVKELVPTRTPYMTSYRKEDNLYICKICSMKYKSTKGVRRHIKNHHFAFNYTCEKCDCKFKDESELNKHKKKPHECIKKRSNKEKVDDCPETGLKNAHIKVDSKSNSSKSVSTEKLSK